MPQVMRDPRVLFVSGLCCALALVLLATQHLSGLFASREIDIGNRSGKAGLAKFGSRGAHYAGLIPERFRRDLVARRGVVLEDGDPLAHRCTSIRSVDDGFGRYAVVSKYAHFRTSDGSDPNSNGRRYSLRVPSPVDPIALWGCFVGCAVLLTLAYRVPDRSVSRPPRNGQVRRPRPRLEFALVAAFAVVGAVWALDTHADYSDGGLCVMGKPYSDAIGWHEVAANLSEGRGFRGSFSDHRPFYPILQAMVFVFAGESLGVAQATNIIFLALGAVFVYFATRRLFSPGVAVAAYVFVLFSPAYRTMAPTLLTELPSYAFGAVGLYLLARGCAPGDSARRGWMLLLAGVFLGCSNLARPFTLLALPLASLAVLYAGRAGGWGMGRTLVRGCILGAGIALVFLPWCIRQKRVNDTWSISLNSSELLYGAAMPGGRGKWSSEQFDEAEAAGIDLGDRRAMEGFFARRLAETVRAGPSGYVQRMAANYVEYLDAFTLGRPVTKCLLAVAVFAALAGATFRSRSILPLLGFPLFWFFGAWADTWPGYALIAILLLLVFAGGGRSARLGAIVAALFLLGPGLLSALVGNFALRRGILLVEWLFVATLVTAAVVLARGWSRAVLALAEKWKAPSSADPEARVAADESRAPLALALGLVVLCLLGGAGLIARTSLAEGPVSPPTVLGASVRASAIEATRAAVPALQGVQAGLVFCEVVRVGDFRWEIPGGHDAGHWSRLFEVRPHSRTSVYLHPGVRRHEDSGHIGAHFRGRLAGVDPSRTYVAVGLRNEVPDPPLDHDAIVIEGLGLIPFDAETGTLRLEDATFFDPCPSAWRFVPASQAR